MTSSTLPSTKVHVTLEMDKFGRILLPKKIRELLHLEAGEKLDLYIEDGKVTIEAAARDAVLIEENGFLVIDSNVPFNDDIVHEIYELRAKDLW